MSQSKSCLTMAVFAAALAANAQMIAPTPVPANLQVPNGHIAYLQASATGTQNYICLPTSSGMAWVFQAPQATLFVNFRWINGEVQQQVSTHFLSPNPAESGQPARATWQSSLDSSSVWAKKIADSMDPAYVAPGAIPWLLLQVTGARRGPTGGATFVNATYIQRVRTQGGIAPTSPCTEPGAIQFVPYTTDYIFFRALDPR